MALEHIQWLARKSATANLSLKEARDLFNTLYAADALALEGGNMTAAARRAGFPMQAPGLRRMLKRGTRIGEPS